MNFLTPIRIALHALRANKLRTLLTVTGIVIGIMSVMVILSAGKAMEQFFIDQVNAFGSNYIQIEIKVPATAQASSENAFNLASGVTITTMTIDDMKAIQELENVDQAYAGDFGQEVVVYRDQNEVAFLYGVSDTYIDIDTSELAEGRFFTEEEDKSLAQVVVLGSKMKEKLFGEQDALGKRIKIGKTNFTVIGVLKERGAVLFFDLDDIVYVPIRTHQKKLAGIDYITMIVATLHDIDRDLETKAIIEDMLRDRHNISDPLYDDFAVTTQEEAQDLLAGVLTAVQILLIAIASISLIVGGVGIMNIMYVSVSERTQEIGLRKSVGATQQSIMWQFLWEAVGVTGVGGIIGVILGVLFSLGITQVAASYGYVFSFTLPWWAFVIAVGFSVAVGMIFGLYPAKKAAELDPITAMRK
ncbi:MAG: ABC transporter permease [Patescibacteria group bacterium]